MFRNREQLPDQKHYSRAVLGVVGTVVPGAVDTKKEDPWIRIRFPDELLRE